MRVLKALLGPWPEPADDAWQHRMFRVYVLPIFIGAVLYGLIGPERGHTVDNPLTPVAIIGLPLGWAWLAHRKTIGWRL